MSLFVSFVDLIWRSSEVLRELAVQRGLVFFPWSIPDLLSNFGAGLIVCTFAYMVWVFADGALARRRASWNYLCASEEKLVSELGRESKAG